MLRMRQRASNIPDGEGYGALGAELFVAPTTVWNWQIGAEMVFLLVSF